MLLIDWVYAYVVVNVVFALVGSSISELHPLVRSAIITNPSCVVKRKTRGGGPI